MGLPVISPRVSLKVNFGIGTFVFLTNAAAFWLSKGRAEAKYENDGVWMIAWAFVGFAVAAIATAGLSKNSRAKVALELHLAIILSILLVLMGWGLLGSSRSNFHWSVGYLSLLGFYLVVMQKSAEQISGYASKFRFPAYLSAVGAIVSDVLIFLKTIF